MNRSIWTFFSGNSVEYIMSDPGVIDNMQRESNRTLSRRGWRTEWRLTRSGLYLNVYDDRGREVGHFSCHNSASQAGSMSHVSVQGRRNQIRRDIAFSQPGRYVIIEYNRESSTVIMRLIINAATLGLAELAREGALRGGGYSDGQDLEIVFVISDIPIDENLLTNLILAKFILEKNLLIDYAQICFGLKSNFVNKTISLNDLMKNNEDNLSYVNKINESLSELSEYTKIFESQLKNELENSNKLILEYIYLDSEINLKETADLTLREDKQSFDIGQGQNSGNSLLDNYKSKYIKYKLKYNDLKKIKQQN